MIRMLGHLTLSQRSLRLSSFLLILFSFPSLLHLFLSFYLLPHLAYLLPLLFYCWFPPDLICCIVHYILTFLFLLDPCYTFLAFSWSLSTGYFFITPICFQDFGSFSLSLFGILYLVDFPISSSFVWFGGHLSCSFTC